MVVEAHPWTNKTEIEKLPDLSNNETLKPIRSMSVIFTDSEEP